MPSLDVLIAGVMLISLVIYTLSGGADYGGGVWDLFATGPRADRQRHVIAEAIAPIWEANHVWLILVVVLLFVCFPAAFAAISTALHVPLALMLVGIVLRGSAFTFRAYSGQEDGPAEHGFRRVFAVASTITPVMLGVVVGALSTGHIRFDPESGRMLTGFFAPWLRPFPFAVGLFVLALFAFLAAVYLTLETDDPDLREDFRRRALVSAAAVFLLAFTSLFLAIGEAPPLHEGLLRRGFSVPLQVVTGASATLAIVALVRRSYRAARLFAVAQVALIVVGWGASQFPYLVVPDFTFADTAAPASVLEPVLVALGVGAVVLIPAFAYLFVVFKRPLGPS